MQSWGGKFVRHWHYLKRTKHFVVYILFFVLAHEPDPYGSKGKVLKVRTIEFITQIIVFASPTNTTKSLSLNSVSQGPDKYSLPMNTLEIEGKLKKIATAFVPSLTLFFYLKYHALK